MGETGKENTETQPLSNSSDLEREKNFDLPDGWKKKIVRRMTGKTSETGSRLWDVYIIPPKGKRLRSTIELMKYIKANPDVPIDPRYVNMEKSLDNEPSKMTSATKKLLDFLEKIRNGENVDVDEYMGNKPRPKPVVNPNCLTTSPMEQMVVNTSTHRYNNKSPKKKANEFRYSQSSNSPQFPHIFQQQQIFHQQLPVRQTYQLSKDPLIPTLLDYLSTTETMPNFTVTQAIKLEKLLIEHPDIPTPDQISEWASELGMNYTDMQEWIRIKWYSKVMSGQSSNSDEIFIEDEEDPLADDVINPAALCNVIMED